MRVKKRLFIGLLVFSLLLAMALLYLGWLLVANRARATYQIVLEVVGGGFLVGILIAALGVLGLVLSIWQAKPIGLLQRSMLWTTALLFPYAMRLGRLLKIDPDTIRGSFIAVNNQLVKGKGVKARPEEILLLAPQCLQRSQCRHKITVDVNNCRRCGLCCINDLHRLAENYGVRFVVATGGTLARKFVQEYRPRAVVAIACERDLTSGIQDSGVLPVLGVLNIRPEGPCFNTRVSLPEVEEAIRYLLRDQAASITARYLPATIPSRGLQGQEK